MSLKKMFISLLKSEKVASEVHICPKYILSLHVHNFGLSLLMHFNPLALELDI